MNVAAGKCRPGVSHGCCGSSRNVSGACDNSRDVTHRLCVLAFGAGVGLACAWQAADRFDRSPHEVQLIEVEKDVRLEVLDWGGSGRPLVLLPGAGNTAHVFDDFAPQLTTGCRVYGITRRGFGASDRPSSGYSDQRLSDDVLQVLRSLKIARPVLLGHSMAGG